MKATGLFMVLILTSLLYNDCKQKKNDVFPAIDFIKAQVAAVDSSVEPIVRLTPITDSSFDTSYIKRDEFDSLSKDFTETPDISKSLGGKYIEERMMNNDIGQAVFIATPSDKNLEVQREEVRIVPGPPDKVKSIYIEKFKSFGDSSVIKRLTWYTDTRFQVVTIVQKKNGDETTSVTEVAWGDVKKD